MNSKRRIAYFSMEVALQSDMPTYSGGLGVLAGDTLRAAADLGLPMVGVTLLHRKGYFSQRIDSSGRQREEPAIWEPETILQDQSPRVSVTLEGRTVQIRAWKHEIAGLSGSQIPVYFLDTDLPENSSSDRTLTDALYGGDDRYRLCQEIVLGIGGVRMLRALGFGEIARFHMNEGHSSLLVLELLDEEARARGKISISHEDLDLVRAKCVFTTHTPVPAGHDQFPLDLVKRVLGRPEIYQMKEVFCCEGFLNMTFLGFNLSHYINGVAKSHAEVSGAMFGSYPIDSITNGVHVGFWTSHAFKELFDRQLPGWREDNPSLRFALGLSKEEVWEAHLRNKRALVERLRQRGAVLESDTFTIGFARRSTAYKRVDLVFYDTQKLQELVARGGPLQFIFAGKAHPRDQGGKELIQRIYQIKDRLANQIAIVYPEDYDLELARLMTAGVDLWLNTPEPPLEASGTSGMKAALNGIPSLSVLDGWWIEGHIEGVTGWSIGERGAAAGSASEAANSIYSKLEFKILPLFYQHRDRYIDVMLHCIALNGSFFNTQRMLQQYVVKAYY